MKPMRLTKTMAGRSGVVALVVVASSALPGCWETDAYDRLYGTTLMWSSESSTNGHLVSGYPCWPLWNQVRSSASLHQLTPR